jgi:protein O-mannosyl-transferase
VRVQTALIGLVLAVMTVAVYLPVRDFAYVEVDDPAYVYENPQVRAGLTWAGVGWAFTTGHAANWHPLTWLSHMLDVELFGLNPGAHHLVNVAFHVSGALLLLIILVRMTGDVWRSGFVAAVFALHPLHVESVAWVAERKDVLSGVFWMVTLWAYVAYTARPTRLRMVAVAAVFSLGLMAKPMLVTLPVVLLLLDLWPLKRWRWRERSSLAPLIREKVPLFALSIFSSVMTLAVQQHAGAVASFEAVSVARRLSLAVVGAATYLFKFAWPANLSFLYPIPDVVPSSTIALSIVVLAALSFLAVRTAVSRPAILVGWLWFLMTLLPVSGIVQTGVQSIADRYMYLPMIGISILVAWAVPDLWKRQWLARAASVAAGFLTLAMAVQTSRQLPTWRSNSSLWTNAMMQSLKTDEYTARITLGRTLLGERRFDEAREHFSQAIRLRPGSFDAHYGLGLAYLHARLPGEAVRPLEEALRLAPADTNVRADLAAAYVLSGRLQEAVREYRSLIEMKPSEPRYKTALDTVLALMARGK